MESAQCLYDIKPGQHATVKALLSQRDMRRRLMDLGLTPGTKVECVGRSPFGDPGAFLIRGAVIALRKKDCQQVIIENTDKPEMPVRKTVALAGNPNVGKSTIFNALTGMKQHTGNWPGKTVALSRGLCRTPGHSCTLVDIPGTYSLMTHSAEEEVARDFICFGQPDAVIVVCDATCLERNMNLVLQILEITPSVIVCINLMDEARRKKIHIDLAALSRRLGVPVVGTNARKKESLTPLLNALDQILSGKHTARPVKVHYAPKIEQAVSMLEPLLAEKQQAASALSDSKVKILNERWLSLKLLERNPSLSGHLDAKTGWHPLGDPEIIEGLSMADHYLTRESIPPDIWDDSISASLVSQSEKICKGVLSFEKKGYHDPDLKLDRIITGRYTAIPLMILMMSGLFWLTVAGANYPSRLLAKGLYSIQKLLASALYSLHTPPWLNSLLIQGLYQELAWVISVMLPPMAIFFPLFTILEDAGFLPRIAYNLDKPFQKCNACGKQCLSMAMGIGCNAVGVTGCRIIDSPRERLLAVLTNSFMPCNGRFPALISIITMFFAGCFSGWKSSAVTSLMMTGVILLGIFMTFFITKLLSGTLLKGIPSSFTLELPPYRRPQIRKVIIRSVFDRTLFVLGRAVCVAAPTGMILWLLANISMDGESLLRLISGFLDPLGRMMGLDGIILAAFLLGFPANETILPVMVMIYLSRTALSASVSLEEMHTIFLANGWTAGTALCVLIFMLMHWPCSTTLLTIKKETGSLKWTALAALIPTSCGIIFCVFLNFLMKFFRIL